MTLTPDQLDFVAKALTVRIATVSPKGVPMVTPLWFGHEGESIYLGTRRDSFHARHLLANPQAVLLFSDQRGRRTRRVLRVRSTAEVGPIGNLARRRLFHVTRRYYLSPKGLWHSLRNIGKFAKMRRYHGERPEVCTIMLTLDSGEWLEQPGA